MRFKCKSVLLSDDRVDLICLSSMLGFGCGLFMRWFSTVLSIDQREYSSLSEPFGACRNLCFGFSPVFNPLFW